MSYLDHIHQCNVFNAENYLPFMVDNEQLGWTKLSFANQLLEFDSVFVLDHSRLQFHPSLNTPELRTDAIAPILQSLHERGVIDSWVNELYAITNSYGEQARFLMERAAVSYFGVRGYGVHINGLVQKEQGIHIWIARRTKEKPFWPGKLDQMVAGGQPAGIGRMQNVIKESAEEAGIPEALASSAHYVGEIHYRGESALSNKRGLSVDTVFNYDLWLPDAFIPENTDGEVDEFILMPLEEMARLTNETTEFKDNCNLVNIDLLLRQGLITASHPDYDEINQRLYAPAVLA